MRLSCGAFPGSRRTFLIVWRGSGRLRGCRGGGLARLLRVSARCVWRWKAGTKPDPGHLVSLFNLAAEMGLLHILLPAVGEPEAAKRRVA